MLRMTSGWGLVRINVQAPEEVAAWPRILLSSRSFSLTPELTLFDRLISRIFGKPCLPAFLVIVRRSLFLVRNCEKTNGTSIPVAMRLGIELYNVIYTGVMCCDSMIVARIHGNLIKLCCSTWTSGPTTGRLSVQTRSISLGFCLPARFSAWGTQTPWQSLTVFSTQVYVEFVCSGIPTTESLDIVDQNESVEQSVWKKSYCKVFQFIWQIVWNLKTSTNSYIISNLFII